MPFEPTHDLESCGNQGGTARGSHWRMCFNALGSVHTMQVWNRSALRDFTLPERVVERPHHAAFPVLTEQQVGFHSRS